MIRFQVSQGQDVKEIRIENGAGVICDIRIEEDSIRAWRATFYKMSQMDEEIETLSSILKNVRALVESTPQDSDARETHARFLHGLYDFLRSNAHPELCRFHQGNIPLLRKYLFTFDAHCDPPHFIIRFQKAEDPDPFLEMKQVTNTFTQGPVPKEVCARMISGVVRKGREQDLATVLTYFDDFQALISQDDPAGDSRKHGSFSNFLQALVDEIISKPNEPSYNLKRVPSVCAFIVKNEQESVEVQKQYLGHILNSSLPDGKKDRLVEEILGDAQNDLDRAKGQNPGSRDEMPQRKLWWGKLLNSNETNKAELRLLTLVNLVAAHYLEQYDLDRAINAWEKFKERSTKLNFVILRALLELHRHPGRVLLGILTFLLVPALLVLVPTVQGAWTRPVAWAPAIMIYAIVLSLVIWVVYQYRRGSPLFYMQLFFPRLFGAIIVGVSILLLDNVPWDFGIKLSPYTILLVVITTLTLSFAYIFYEVYGTIRYQRTRSIHDAVTVSRNLFLIGLNEAIIAVFVASTLFYPALYPHLPQGAGLVVNTNVGGSLSITYFPGLIALWSGLSLFVGAFVQLMWQEKRITAPV